jgi:hypothetical protein
VGAEAVEVEITH